jgi:hypothetical protein
MSKTKQVLILAVIAAVSAAVGMIANNLFGASSVQANQGGRSGAQKWEYCAITNVYWSDNNIGVRPVAVIRYFQAGGEKEETVEFAPDFGKSAELRDALAKAIAKLGDQGWEMFLKDPDGRYFKRPKQ